MYERTFSREAEKDYQKLSSQMARRVNQNLDQICQDPFRFPQAVALKGELTGHYRWRVGDWRIIYTVDTAARIVHIVNIPHRSQAY